MEVSSSFAIANYLMQAAGIPAPWRATRYRIDVAARIAHLWITRHPLPEAGKTRGWFGKAAEQPGMQAPASVPELQWRHLNCMEYTCQIHTADELDADHYALPWLGQPGLPFSNQLSRQIFACLMEGMEMSAICATLNIPFADLWKFKFALDHGQVKFDYTPARKTRAGAPAASQPAAGAAALPDVADPVWERLVTGELDIQSTTLSFQLILTKIRLQVSIQQDDVVKLMKLRELHRYVERNQRSLGYELRQLMEYAQAQSA